MATTYTPNYHLGKQEDRSDKFLMQVITENMDIIDEQLKATDDKATAAAAGLKYKGAVNYYSDLPNDAEIGDAYTVLYAGSSGTVPDGTEYVWGELNGTAQWIDFSKDSYTKAEVNGLLAAKQNTIDSDHKISADVVDDSSSTNKFNVQANWTQSSSSAADYIKNKPTLGTAAAKNVPSSGNASSTEVVMGNDSRLSDSRTPTAHNQAANTINAMTGYSKPSSTSAIGTGDTLNAAIGKLEKKADDNQNNILTLINYFEFFPISEKTNAGAGNVVNQALKLQAGKYRFTAIVSGTGSSQLKFTIGESGDTVDTKTWQNSVGTISEVYNLTSDTTWVTLYANAAVTYTDMSLKIEL